MHTTKNLFVAIACLFTAVSAQAGPLARDQVPESLKPWTDWVLKGHEEALCPFLNGLEGQRHCAWASPLTLSLDEKAGQFTQDWRLYAEGWVPLPGDDKHWPLGVTVDGQAAAVVLVDEVPQVYLKAGEHTVLGTFEWDSLPESFPIPTETAALKLTVRGGDVTRPNITDEGLLWLQAKEKESEAEERLDARIHRHLEDDIPFVLTTSIDLDVSGKSREAVFAPLLPKGFVPMALESSLPAHLEDDGRLKVQVRSGKWQIRLKARHEGPVTEITFEKYQENETQRQGRVEGEAPAALPMEGATRAPTNEQVCVFSPKPELRQVTIEGAAEAVDPQQTTLPNEWKRLAAYRVRPGDTIRLVEQRRGDSDPAPDQLTLHRTLWLDFNGGGYTVQDRIGGAFNRNERMEMDAPVALGRVSVNGQDQLITRLPDNPKAGIEVRQGAANIGADSRIDGARASIPAIGWNHDFQNVSAVLNLPPGWRAIGIWGADHVPNTWLNRWSLLDIFLAILLALSFAKIWRVRWGWIALAALTLTFPETDAPKWAWLAVVIGEALVRLLPPGFQGKIRIPLKTYRIGAIIVLLIITIPFAVLSLRKALYPSLEHVSSAFDMGIAPATLSAPIPPPPPSPAPAMAGAAMVAPRDASRADARDGRQEEAVPQEQAEMEAPRGRAMKMAAKDEGMKVSRPLLKKSRVMMNEQAFQQIPGAQVQTGPGLPRWNWNSISLEWSGPVAKGESLRLILFGPCINLVLAFVRLILLTLLILRIIDFPGNFWPAFMKRSLIATLTLTLGLGLLLSSRPAHAADFPSPELLNDLRERLLEKPVCSPECASVPRLKLETTSGTLRLRIEVAAQARTAVPLPSNPKEWIPSQVSVDGSKFAGVLRTDDGRAWVEVGPGLHQVVIEGPLADRQTLQIPLPLKPHHVEANLQGWSIEGIHEDGQAEDNLQLTRTEPLAAAAASGAKQVTNNLPPFVRVERRLALGLTWSIETQVVRLTPTGSSIVLEVPLITGESVTTDGVRVQNGKVLVSMGPQSGEFSWSSVLQQSGKIDLAAPDQVAWVELWEVDASSIWHLDPDGIPLIHTAADNRVLQWRPWPGETIAMTVSRPEGVPGQTKTIDDSTLSISPGLRFTESTLRMGIRSSLGGQHEVTLPAGAELQSVSVNGQVQPIRQVERKVSLPLAPGAQNFELKWQQPGGIGIFFRSPVVDLGLASVNSDIQFDIPERWVLLLGGPSLGPAVLFWSLLIVMILVAIGLSRTGRSPLKTYHWVLLSLGLTQTPIVASLVFAGWFLVLGWRKRTTSLGPWAFDLAQILLVGWTMAAVTILFVSIHQGLLGSPDMQILGNDSTSLMLRWFQDRSGGTLARPWVVSIPMFCYRIAMLSWALWVAWAFISWIKWGWTCFTNGGMWRPVRLVRK